MAPWSEFELEELSDVVDATCPHYSKFWYEGCRVTKKGDDEGHLLGRISLAHKPIVSIKVGGKLAFGFMDANDPSEESMIHYGASGAVMDGDHKVGHAAPFAQGDRVTLAIDFKDGVVTWSLNGKHSFHRLTKPPTPWLSCLLTKNQTIKWVPFVYMAQKGDWV